jgi:hypothetical protein
MPDMVNPYLKHQRFLLARAQQLLNIAYGCKSMNAAPDKIGRNAISRRTGFLLGLDISMFVLVCVLECLSLTGLALHEWLGFALCPLVLLHVVLQWSWFIAQFRRVLAPGAYRARVNLWLNVVLLVLMAAVLFSGVLISNQVAPLLAEHLGRTRVWNEIHGWLNFVLVVVVGLHLALNWDWIIAAVRRQRVLQHPNVPEMSARNAGAPSVRYSRIAISLWRGMVVFAVALLSALAVYMAMAAMLRPKEARAGIQKEHKTVLQAAGTPQRQTLRRGRPASLPHGFQELAVTVSVIVFVVLVARYVLRMHL